MRINDSDCIGACSLPMVPLSSGRIRPSILLSYVGGDGAVVSRTPFRMGAASSKRDVEWLALSKGRK